MNDPDFILSSIGFFFALFLNFYVEYIVRLMKKEDLSLWMNFGNFSIFSNDNLKNVPKFWKMVFFGKVENEKIKSSLSILKYSTIIYIIYLVCIFYIVFNK